MQRATRTTARTLGAYAGVIALQHGVSELLQRGRTPQGLLIQAVGPPCRPEAVWHACLPAMTVLPSFRAAGAATVLVSLTMLVGSISFGRSQRLGLAVIGASVLALLLGGGFVAPFIGLVGGAAATVGARVGQGRIQSEGPVALLGGLWPWPLVAMAVWLPGGWLLGRLFSEAMVRLSGALFLVFDLGFPLLAVVTARARDLSGPNQTHEPSSIAPA